jgi:hypothetical protein
LPEPSAVVVPSTVVPSVSYKVTAEPASAVPVSVGVVSLVRLSVEEVPLSDAALKSGAEGVVGAIASIVTDKALDTEELLPAPSVALAVRV